MYTKNLEKNSSSLHRDPARYGVICLSITYKKVRIIATVIFDIPLIYLVIEVLDSRAWVEFKKMDCCDFLSKLILILIDKKESEIICTKYRIIDYHP